MGYACSDSETQADAYGGWEYINAASWKQDGVRDSCDCLNHSTENSSTRASTIEFAFSLTSLLLEILFALCFLIYSIGGLFGIMSMKDLPVLSGIDDGIEITFELTDELSTPTSSSSSKKRPSSQSISALSLLSLPPDPNCHLDHLSPIGCTVQTSTYRGTYMGNLVSVKLWRGPCGSSESDKRERRRFRKHLEQPLLTWLSLSSLKHPNITPLYGLVFAFGKLPAIVTPYYANGDINCYVKESLRNPDREVDVKKLFEMVAAALAYMHSLNPPVSHGDVRGSNIQITSSGTPVLTEIGTSHLPFPPDWTIGSDDGTRWMAPELMSPDSDIDMYYVQEKEDDEDLLRLRTTPMCDVYSFGMTMFEVCTGRIPFSHRKFYGGVVYDVVSGKRPPRPSPSDAYASLLLTDKIWEIIQTCWEQKPKHRPTMSSVRTWLRSVPSRSSQTRRQQTC
ncbi:hypothetical protein D9758_005616 [Tetrapyrgos nigripes]|uniref:Protein kinase domain-containing protein n=1 Tax=Tetrapyrgos nigripes TaxID=182062 RepID=A0A8H5GGI4_9AGAR|nr:hypothetical protein D9758_005616 [Tetrapyrgos nigripes]